MRSEERGVRSEITEQHCCEQNLCFSYSHSSLLTPLSSLNNLLLKIRYETKKSSFFILLSSFFLLPLQRKF